MYFFRNDYGEGCHPRILEALERTNLESTVGYGLDEHCARAAEAIKAAIDCPEADVHFLVGGTQTNATAISAFLRPHQGAVAVSTGHINTHETGAVEATGHKILTRDNSAGKVTPAMVEDVVQTQSDEHVIQPKLVYISQSTELGTVYTREELEALRAVCDRHGLYLYLDGARLSCGLAASNVRFPDLARLCDAFYIGGTKNGALFGEALVIVNPALKPDFRYYIKRHGGMLAKGWLLGIQFEELFRDDLYLSLGRRANGLAQRLQSALTRLGVESLHISTTNQIFPVLPNRLLEPLAEFCSYEVWTPLERNRTAIRLVTSWATPDEAVEGFLTEFRALWGTKK